MATNLLKKYAELLEFLYPNTEKNIKSFRAVFDRDIVSNKLQFRQKSIHPTPDEDGKDRVDDLFHHLTTKGDGKNSEGRFLDSDRTVRLHWIRHHIEEKKENKMLVFSTDEGRNGFRTYIYDKEEEYVIVLNPLRSYDAYYLLTAYKLKGKDKERNKIEKKYKRDRLPDIL